ncbi:MAG TPA: glycine--tRNA ligase [Polyangia bacterium]|jgi:glycyl-tRNA synthetase|nr:glycine--tRNA ligase [Polyangia bacterium]
MAVDPAQLMDKLTALCRRRGFLFQSSEIYGGINGAWDYGPMGVELKRNVKDAWWEAMVRSREDVVGLDSAILMHPLTWKASGHIENFADPMIDCKKCKKRYRVDEIEPEYETTGKVPTVCPDPKCKGELTPARKFNLMFETNIGPVVESAAKTYLRPETAQGIFANFANVVSSTRIKVPFGIAQIGKSFRNEINPRNYTFRSREFEQMELEFFCRPGTDDEWFTYWVEARKNWYFRLGMKPDRLRLRAHEKEKLSHYSKATTDVEYLFPFGWGELEGIANRTDYDLRQHQIGMRSVGKWNGEDLQDFRLVAEDPDYAGGKLSYFDDEEKRRYIPYVIEPSAGADRATLAFLCDAYDEDVANNETRVVLRLHPRLAPIKAAILPLVKKDGMPERAQTLYQALKRRWSVMYDDAAAIGKRYRRQDEVGTPLCFTIDGDTLKDGTVTVRERDSMKQERIAEDQVLRYVEDALSR